MPTVPTVPIVTGQPVSKSAASTQETRNPLRAAQLSPGTDAKPQNGAHEVYIGGVSKDNTSDDVVTFLKAEHIHNIHSAQSLGKKGEWQSFKVTMSKADHDRALNVKWPTGIRVRPFLARSPKSSAKPSLSGRNPPKQELSSSQQAPRRYRPASQGFQRRKHEKFENYNQYKSDRQFTYRPRGSSNSNRSHDDYYGSHDAYWSRDDAYIYSDDTYRSRDLDRGSDSARRPQDDYYRRY